MKTKAIRERFIRISNREVGKFIGDLSLLVVSFDRLGSAFYDEPLKRAIATDKFLSDTNAFRLLSRMRRVLSEVYESQLGRAEMERLEKQLEKVKVWGERGFRRRRII